ncbi:formate--tetrahydrofolate ligase [Psychromicrobium lacuslunae]|uniref:Formate--tetrahydrofolate ligase n=1 Tax=Psychromicrobium lacuslunae TaxID=1618207 RepID=A0A0D4BZU2_9MICC|nr:formate--tetrahydrofolate ligase [Psychromicrobium lacuslunae]AJT41660.1 formate--tetrahydrofolate ligase [Psychromicrobium lacuslunae]
MTSTVQVLSDLEIAQQATLQPIADIAEAAGVPAAAFEPYGKFKAKLNVEQIPDTGRRGQVVLVSAVSPTPAGEGKSTLTVGLADSLSRAFSQDGSGRRAMIALREPSLGPTLGMKGGATGGGYSQVLPMEEINLHFTGDFHAITTANNALCALIDNHIYQGNALNIDPRRITFKRVLDMNDRALREVVIGLGGPTQGVPRQDGFDITVASEIMAVFCLSKNLEELKERIGRITFGYDYQRKPLTVAELGVEGALTLLLKEALKPNLVQTIAGTPALVHGGPFANIAHGCNSVIATSLARRLADVVVTEAGFGADLGAEKYLDITSRAADIAPDAVVLVATVRALKMHGGLAKSELSTPNLAALQKGVANLERHIANVRQFGLDPVISINRFSADSAEELDWLVSWCESQQVAVAVADVWGRGGGGDGGDELAAKVLKALATPNQFDHLYPLDLPVKEKIELIAGQIYRASQVEFAPAALKRLAEIEANGWNSLPVCIAKTQYSFSDDATLLGAPSGFTLHVRDLVPKTGAGFVVALTGAVMTMPGLPKIPAALAMNVDAQGRAVGLS